MPRSPALFLFFVICLVVRADTPPVEMLRPGESLTYRVGWGLFGNAGEIVIAARGEMIEGAPRLRVATTSATRGVIRTLYPFDGDAWTLFDRATGRLLGGAAETKAGKKQTRASIALDHGNGRAVYTDHLRPRRSAVVPIPDGRFPVDFITALIQGRAWGLAPGQTREALVLFDKEFYPLQITAEREDTIATPDGPRQAVLLVPRMIENPKGMFKRGGEIHIWVSADEDRLPLRFEVKLKVGTAVAVLTDYRRPDSP